MNQRWAEVLCVLAAGSIAWLRGDRMSICSNLQWIEFDGSKGCVNSWEFSMGVQHMEACQWLQDHIWSCKIGKVGSRTFSAQGTASQGIGASVSHLHISTANIKALRGSLGALSVNKLSHVPKLQPISAVYENQWCRIWSRVLIELSALEIPHPFF